MTVMPEPEREDLYRDWPEMLRRVRDLIGTELALKLANDCGGLERLHIPRTPQPTHPWLRSVGREAFCKLAQAFGDQRVSLPRGAYLTLQKRRILELHEQGMAHQEIALTCRVGERYVRRVLALVGRRRADPRQMKLF